jgi:hypothetical protein
MALLEMDQLLMGIEVLPILPKTYPPGTRPCYLQDVKLLYSYVVEK